MREGDWITLDGGDGSVYSGQMELVRPEPPKAYETLMKWADKTRKLGVRTNADTPQDARVAREMGAEGIGLCRTEHMFFKDFEHPEKSAERQHAIQEMILADTSEARRKALDKLLPFQRRDFIGIFEAMDGFPVTIRLIDPPLHEFVPHDRGQTGRAGEEDRHLGAKRWRAASSNFTKQTRCSAIAGAGFRSPIRKFSRCRCARSSKRPSIAKSGRLKYCLRSCIRSPWTKRS